MEPANSVQNKEPVARTDFYVPRQTGRRFFAAMSPPKSGESVTLVVTGKPGNRVCALMLRTLMCMPMCS